MNEEKPSMPVLTVIYTLAEWGKRYGNRRIAKVEIRPDNTVFIDDVEETPKKENE